MASTTPEQKPAEASVANVKHPDHIADILAGRRKRVPMSTATRKMEVGAIDGFYLYWHLETNVPAAMQAGYEFVDRNEANLVNVGLAADRSNNGNTDLGTRVSMIGSLQGTNGGPERAYLMKLRQEWRNEDQEKTIEVAQRPLRAIFKDEHIAGPEGTIRERSPLEYVRTSQVQNMPLFNRPTRKAKIVR